MYDKYYTILGLKNTAGKEEIKRAYRRLAKKFHPDVSTSPNAQEKFIEICEAYEILINSKRPLKERFKEAQEDFIKKAKERARHRAKMKEEKLRQEMEELKKSGLYDVLLVLKYGLHTIILLAIPVLIGLPIYFGVTEDREALYALIFTGIVATILILYVTAMGKKYFRLGKFYFTWEMIRARLKIKNTHSSYECCYRDGENANSKFYKVTFLKVKNIKLDRGGAFMHSVQYKRVYKSIEIPRSKKAFTVHLYKTFLKIAAITGCMIFLNFDSITWRFITGVLLGAGLSYMLSILTSTRSRTSYLLTRGLLLKILIWLNIVMLMTSIDSGFNFQESRYLPVVLVIILFFDAALESILDGIPDGFSQKALVKQPDQIMELKNKGFRAYLSAPVISLVYPFFKWIFG